MTKATRPHRTNVLRPDELLPPVSCWTTIGGAILIGSVGSAVVLAASLRYSLTVRAPAVVRPSGELRLVQAERAGTIAQIAVQENQAVQAGDVIAVMNAVSLEVEQQQLKNAIRQSQLQIAQMDAQLRLMAAQIDDEGRSLDRDISIAEAELSNIQRQAQEQQVTVQANLEEAQANLAFARSEERRYAQLVESGAVSHLQLEEKQATVQTAEAQVARAEVVIGPSLAPVTIAQDRVEQQRSRRPAVLATLMREQEALIQARSVLERQLSADQQALQQTELNLQQTVIRAPHDGIVHQLALRNVNQVVQASDTIAAIAPNTNNLSLRAAVVPTDIARVELGQQVKMRVSACPFPDFGTLSGQVVSISPDAIAFNSTSSTGSELTAASSSGQPQSRFFEVTIAPETIQLEKGDRQCALQPGMNAQVSIISRQESLLRFILRKARLTAP
ncbi:MAG: HlyD family efflux transporter periplasmic adaptor subunit [Cyanobacteria bacterium P01_E01_bin.6]